MLKLVTERRLCALFSPPSIHFSLISAYTSEGVIAYYWSQFDVPVEDLELVPEFSEERVLETLENGTQMVGRLGSKKEFKISEVTAASGYHRGQGSWWEGGRMGAPRGRKMRSTGSLLQLAPDYDI